MGVKELVIAMMAVSMLLLPGIIFISDFVRPDTYNATMGSDAASAAANQANLLELQSTLNQTYGVSADMKEKLNNSVITQGDTTTGNLFDGSVSMFGLVISTFTLLLALPTVIWNTGTIVIQILPFNLGWLIAGLVGIVGFIFVYGMMKMNTRTDF